MNFYAQKTENFASEPRNIEVYLVESPSDSFALSMCVLAPSISPASRDFLAWSRCLFASSGHIGGQSASAFCAEIQDTNKRRCY